MPRPRARGEDPLRGVRQGGAQRLPPGLDARGARGLRLLGVPGVPLLPLLRHAHCEGVERRRRLVRDVRHGGLRAATAASARACTTRRRRRRRMISANGARCGCMWTATAWTTRPTRPTRPGRLATRSTSAPTASAAAAPTTWRSGATWRGGRQDPAEAHPVLARAWRSSAPTAGWASVSPTTRTDAPPSSAGRTSARSPPPKRGGCWVRRRRRRPRRCALGGGCRRQRHRARGGGDGGGGSSGFRWPHCAGGEKDGDACKVEPAPACRTRLWRPRWLPTGPGTPRRRQRRHPRWWRRGRRGQLRRVQR